MCGPRDPNATRYTPFLYPACYLGGLELICGEPEPFTDDLAAQALRPSLEAYGNRCWGNSAAGRELDDDTVRVEGHQGEPKTPRAQTATHKHMPKLSIAKDAEAIGNRSSRH